MNYTEIKDMALSYSDREDSDLALRLDGFLFVVESKINRWLTTMSMEAFQQYAWVSDSTTVFNLPSDFSELRAIRLLTVTGGFVKNYELINPAQMVNAVVNGSDNDYYSLADDKIRINSGFNNTQMLEILYNQFLTPLSLTTPTNWLSIKYPDCYIMGLLVEISTFAKDWTAVDGFKARFEEILAAIELKDKIAKHSGNPYRTRTG
jgi:hypothetical protein